MLTTMRPGTFWKSLSKVRSTSRSLPVSWVRSELVESDSRQSTPSSPSSPQRSRSVFNPSMGSGSSLKSPVWMRGPSGVRRM